MVIEETTSPAQDGVNVVTGGMLLTAQFYLTSRMINTLILRPVLD